MTPKSLEQFRAQEVKNLRRQVSAKNQEIEALKAALEAAQVNEARYLWIEENATSRGGGHGFTLQVFVPYDVEDWGLGIDLAMKARPVPL